VRAYTEADLEQIKKKYGLVELLEGEIVLESGEKIVLPLTPFDVASFDRYADENFKNTAAANEALLFRATRFYSAAEINSLRARCASLPDQVFAVLAADAGFPIEPPARYQVDAFDATTPPLVLEQAGLDEAAAERLVADLAGEPAKIVLVLDNSADVIFAGVLAAPGEAETHILQKASETEKGLAAAARSAVAGCLRWSSVPTETTWKRYPAIPVMCLRPTIKDMGGASATRRFRRR
jgi:hypothetical protein